MVHVLCVERDRGLRELLSEALVERGYMVTAVASAPAALRALDGPPERAPDVCIVDARDDGALLAAIRARQRVPVLTLNGGPEPGRGDVDLRRPFTVAALERAVEEALARTGRHAPRAGEGPQP
jgi:CheY-like chemotaxis protein